jgi:hypothetical protein
MIYGFSPRAVQVAAALAAALSAAPASAADKVNVSGLRDVSFGTVTSFSDKSVSQSICAYSQSTTNSYAVIATGSGQGGAFTLTSGGASMAYEVLWSATSGQTGGTLLEAGRPATGFESAATQKTCNSGPASSASLTVVLRTSALNAATAGPYSGSLQITIAPE